jgi:hypothetical protein
MTVEALQALTTAISRLQLQMMAVHNQLADQDTRLLTVDGRATFMPFGLPGFGGVPALPTPYQPGISDVTMASKDSSATPQLSTPLSTMAFHSLRLAHPLP